MNAAFCNEIETVIWMLSNGSSISENCTKKRISCKNMMKIKGIYETLACIYKSKSSRK